MLLEACFSRYERYEDALIEHAFVVQLLISAVNFVKSFLGLG